MASYYEEKKNSIFKAKIWYLKILLSRNLSNNGVKLESVVGVEEKWWI